jgi:hypothetical protein
MSTASEDAESVDAFLERIASLKDKRDREDEERTRKLEEDILQGRRKRQARRAGKWFWLVFGWRRSMLNKVYMQQNAQGHCHHPRILSLRPVQLFWIHFITGQTQSTLFNRQSPCHPLLRFIPWSASTNLKP